MTNQNSFLDELALKWKEEDDKFFLDSPYSNDYVEMEISETKKHAWPIDEHEIAESHNLVTIFESHFRNSKHAGFVPYFDMIDEMFNDKTFPPPELDLGTIIVFEDIQLTDVLSGVEGNFGNKGCVISKKLLSLLRQHNIGQFQTYSLKVRHRNNLLSNYVYLHFHNYADKYVDFSKSRFYIQKGSDLDVENRTVITVTSLSEIEKIEDNQNSQLERVDWKNLVSIHPKELFLSKNDLDLFKFEDLSTTDFFMSVRLAKEIDKENITGFDLKKTTKLKMLYS
ncbi:MAG: hypothetical protein IPO01_14960 [Chitinophagaceae bacterium]|nr:hypothetical protein [Chitinophagaceae bacterium]MBK8788169.1 hypothetical protein [Chitinophagaceae bacterium]MBK9486432.1 hypothetical protein [Chitinophagaceae bacterium]